MLHKLHFQVTCVARDYNLKFLIRDYFDLPKGTALLPALLARGLGQADLVLCLLRLRDAHSGLRRAAEGHIAALVGHAITVGPPCLMYYRASGAPTVRTDLSPRISWVASENPRLPRTEAYLRWADFKIGRTEAQLKLRGVTRRDFRKAVRRGWIKLEEKV